MTEKSEPMQDSGFWGRVAAQQDEPAQEPYCYMYEYDTPLGMHRTLYPKEHNGKQPDRAIPLYTAPPKAEPVEPVACSNTFACQCSKHFASQQSEQRPKRVLTAVWRDRAQRAEAQRDALLEALNSFMHEFGDKANSATVQKARAAIKMVEGEKK